MKDKLILWWNSHCPTKRRLIQLYSALLYNAHMKGFITGEIYKGKLKAICVPGFNCYSCPGAVGACPLGSLQASLSSSGKQAGFYILGIFLLYGLIAGRTICGWFCPLGLIQELLHKIPTPKIQKSRVTRALSWLKYVFLAVFVVAVTLWYGLKRSMAVPAFCKYICPAGTFEGAIGLLSNPNNASYFGMLGIYFTRKFVIMMIIAGLCIFIYRAFCRFICPLGAIYGMFNSLSLIGVKVDLNTCSGCGACVRNCKMDVRRVGDHECIHCGHCIDKCAKNAISLKAGNFTLIASKRDEAGNSPKIVEKRRKIEKYSWTAALILFGLIFIWVNFLDPSGKKKTPKNSTIVSSTAKGTLDPEKSERLWGKVTQSSSLNRDVFENIGDAPVSHENETTAGFESDAPVSSENEAAPGSENEAPVSYESTAETGYEVGQQLEDFTATCFDGTEFNLHENRGKVTVINLWATWCGPCVKELPYFNEFYHKHEDDAVVLACHSSSAPEDVPEFLSDKGWDMLFTIDDEENGIFEKANCQGVLPQTIVLNRKGEVIYNEIRSITPEMLEQLYEEAAKDEPAPKEEPEKEEPPKEEAAVNNDAAKEEAADEEPVKEDPKEESFDETDGAEEPAKDPDEDFGYEEGDVLKDFTVECLDGSTFRLSENTGKVTVINLWASYSKDSIKGLKELQKFYDDHKDEASVLALHNYFGSDKCEECSKGLDVPVAVDNSEEEIFTLAGGSMAVPRTVILNKEGIVIYNERGVLDKEELDELVKDAMKE